MTSMDTKNLSASQIEDVISRLETEQRQREAERAERMKSLKGDAFWAESDKGGGWLSWITPSVRAAMRRGIEGRLGAGEPSVELKEPDRRPDLPRIVPADVEDLTQLIDKTAQPRHAWIQPSRKDASKIEEGWFVSSNGIVALHDNGRPMHRYMRRLREGEDEVMAAKELLRRKCNDEFRPMSGPIRYFDDGVA